MNNAGCYWKISLISTGFILRESGKFILIKFFMRLSGIDLYMPYKIEVNPQEKYVSILLAPEQATA